MEFEGGPSVGWFVFVERNGVFEGAFAKLFARPGEVVRLRLSVVECNLGPRAAPAPIACQKRGPKGCTLCRDRAASNR